MIAELSGFYILVSFFPSGYGLFGHLLHPRHTDRKIRPGSQGTDP